MLSTKKCRSLLAEGDHTDEEIDNIRDEMYALAETIVDVMRSTKVPEEFRKEKRSKRPSLRLV